MFAHSWSHVSVCVCVCVCAQLGSVSHAVNPLDEVEPIKYRQYLEEQPRTEHVLEVRRVCVRVCACVCVCVCVVPVPCSVWQAHLLSASNCRRIMCVYVSLQIGTMDVIDWVDGASVSSAPLLLVDVRSHEEVSVSTLPGALHLPVQEDSSEPLGW